MAGEQFLSSTTKFVKKVAGSAEEPTNRVEPRKIISSPPPNRLQTELSFTPIKSIIGVQNATNLSMPINTPTRNRNITEVANYDATLNQKSS